MFAYCGNNPANCSDSSGCRPSWEHNAGNGLWEYTDSGTGATLSDNEDDSLDWLLRQFGTPIHGGGTFSVGVSTGFTHGDISGSTSYAITNDTGYNYLPQTTTGLGANSFGLGAFAGLTITFTNATNSTDTNGESTSYGFSFFGFSVDVFLFPLEGAPFDTGLGISVTTGVGLGFGIHGSDNYTTGSEVWNPFRRK